MGRASHVGHWMYSYPRLEPHGPRQTRITQWHPNLLPGQTKEYTREILWLHRQKSLHTPTCTTMQGGGTRDSQSQRSPRLPHPDGDKIFHSLLCPRQTNQILRLGQNRTKTCRCNHQRHIIPYSGPLRRSRDTSSMATPNWHHHWYHSDRHIFQNIHLPPTWQCGGNARERK